MSKTIRRTRGNVEVIGTYRQIDGEGPFRWVQLPKTDPEYGKLYWEYHGDQHSGIYGVPRAYRRWLNKQAKSVEAVRLHRALKSEAQDVVDSPRKLNAGYTWW